MLNRRTLIAKAPLAALATIALPSSTRALSPAPAYNTLTQAENLVVTARTTANQLVAGGRSNSEQLLTTARAAAAIFGSWATTGLNALIQKYINAELNMVDIPAITPEYLSSMVVPICNIPAPNFDGLCNYLQHSSSVVRAAFREYDIGMWEGWFVQYLFEAAIASRASVDLHPKAELAQFDATPSPYNANCQLEAVTLSALGAGFGILAVLAPEVDLGIALAGTGISLAKMCSLFAGMFGLGGIFLGYGC